MSDVNGAETERPPAAPAVPGVVLAAALLLGCAGALALLFGVVRFAGGRSTWLAAAWSIGYGLFFVGVAVGLCRRYRWVWWTVLALCVLGAVRSVVVLATAEAVRAVEAVAGPVLYAVLLTRPSARAWFLAGRGGDRPAAPDPG